MSFIVTIITQVTNPRKGSKKTSNHIFHNRCGHGHCLTLVVRNLSYANYEMCSWWISDIQKHTHINQKSIEPLIWIKFKMHNLLCNILLHTCLSSSARHKFKPQVQPTQIQRNFPSTSILPFFSQWIIFT